MDKYGVCGLDDAAMLAENLKDGENILFSFSQDDVTAHILFIGERFDKIGTMPFGGNPEGAYIVGILYKGFYYFNLDGSELHPGYVGEKLRLSETDAEHVTKMLNAIQRELICV